MNRMIAFARRNSKEVWRDLLTLVFGIGLPLILLVLFMLMQRNLPVEIYKPESITPGIAVFSFSFLSMFGGMLISKDRSSSFLLRVFASPLEPADYLLGYSLPMIPVAFFQIAVCYGTAFLFGLEPNADVFLSIPVLLVIALFYMGIGLLFGTVLGDKQFGGVFSLFINVSTWLSGTWFELDLVGTGFAKVCRLLPFANAVDAAKAAVAGDWASVGIPLLWVGGYTVLIYLLAILLFKKKMKN